MKVLNFGSCNIDYVYQMEHFIRPGETAPCTALSAGCGGKGLNQSIALAKAGTEVYHAGLYGAEGKFLLDKMQEAGVNTSLMRLGEGANGHAIIQVERSGQNCIILYGGTNRQITQDYADEVLSHFAAGDVLVLQNEINNMPYIMKKAHERGLRIAFNAAPYGQEVLSYPLETVTWLIVNEVEGAGLSGKTDYEEIAEALAEQYPGMNIMLTMGKSGCLYKGNGETVRLGACHVDAVDTTAAGDTFIGYFVRGILQGLSMRDTLRQATVASAIAVTRPGAADSVPSIDEVLASPLLDTI